MGGASGLRNIPMALGRRLLLLSWNSWYEIAGAKKELMVHLEDNAGVQDPAIVSVVERRHLK